MNDALRCSAVFWAFWSLIIMILCFCPQSAAAQGVFAHPDSEHEVAVTYTEPPEENLLIVGVEVNKITLDMGIIVYFDEDGLIVPLGALTELLKFAIDVKPEKGQAQGWFINQDQNFYLKHPYQFIEINGKRINLAPDMVQTHLDDIYVRREAVEQWFPIKLNLNFNELKLYIEPEAELPFQTEAKRRAKWQSIQAQTGSRQVEYDGEIIHLPYKRFAPPSIQVTQNMSYADEASDPNLLTSSTVQLQGDFLHMDMRANANFTTDENGKDALQNILFTLKREDYRGKMGEFMKATRFEVGDVTASGLALSSGNQLGRGFFIENTPINYVKDANNFVIEGFGPVGWDVEVYQDERLLDFQNIDVSGEYKFETLPLKNGFNLFQIKLFGPNGEEIERFERFYLGANMVQAGQFLYHIGALQSSTRLIDVSANKAPETPGTISLLGEYGLRKNLSASFGYFQGPLADTSQRGVGGGLRYSSKHAFTQGNVFVNDNGGRSADISVRGNLGKNVHWSLGHEEHKGYSATEKPTTSKTFGRISQQFSLKLATNLSYNFEVRNEELATGEQRVILLNTQAANFMGMNLTNDLEYIMRSNVDDDSFLGTLTIRKRAPFGTLRGRMQYDLGEDQEIDSIEIQFQTKLARDIYLNSVLNSIFGDNEETSLSTTLDFRFDKFRLGLNGAFSDTGDKRIGLDLSYNFIPKNLKGDYLMTGDTADLNTGQIIVKPFLDKDQNGVRDEGEDYIASVDFRNRLRGTRATTNEIGEAIIPGLVPNLVNRVEMDVATLPDIYMSPTQKALYIMGKQGVNGPVDYAVEQLGEVNGVIRRYDPNTGEETFIANAKIILLDHNGKQVAETYSEYDGYYAFSSLSLGAYELFFPPSQAMNAWYRGNGVGPKFSLTSEMPEKMDMDVWVSYDRLSHENHVPEKDASLHIYNNVSVKNPLKQEIVATKQHKDPFMSLSIRKLEE